MNLVTLYALASVANAGWWREVPATEEEVSKITQLAGSELPSELAEAGFDSVSITKQEFEYETSDEPPKNGKNESLRFYGTFPDSLSTGEYRERYAIQCSIYTEFVDFEVAANSKNCDQGIERFLTFYGVDSELRLDEVVELDLAKALLDFLSTQIGPVRGQPLITQSDFSQFERIGIRHERPKRVAVYWSGGSTTYGISFEVKGDDEYQFYHMKDESYVID